MKLRTRYVIYSVLLFCILFLLSFQLLPEHKWWFFSVEVLILASIGFSVNLYRSLIRPVNLIAAGIETLKDQDFSTKLIPVGQYEMDRLIKVYNRMIEQLRNERIRQREQHFFLERLIEASPIGIIVLDYDGLISTLNPTARRMLGEKIEGCQGCALSDLPGDLAACLDRLIPGEAQIITLSGMSSYKCRKSQFRDQGFYHHFIVIEELTDEIYRTEKQAYGKIIRLMSHEINNSIGAVNSILDSFKSYRGFLPETDQSDFGQAIAVATDRNRNLSRFISDYAEVIRLPVPVMRKQDLHQLLESAATLAANDCEKLNIEWVWELDKQPFEVHIDQQQFEQAVLNIVKNSLEAIGENGQVNVITKRHPVMSMIIRDNGIGFDDGVRRQLFTPFFSTKKNGQGIGLTLVREILMNHGFRFELVRTKDETTEFRIEFGAG